ncbi:MAG: tyrosine-type recombinase/integrase [Acidimicrobiia bacterium]|nr:tyrosine-type recombinase/integrase [Acidimicrobiia bacterium]MYC58564.1 tyrosine-type recombinase/integrase [Acidimicrobiia bacterium]MYI30329.1 tyrosine-type recombinase/integrase [Acidimicrobiia bacterium]
MVSGPRLRHLQHGRRGHRRGPAGEARNATWDEIDFAAREWNIPADKTKAASEHRVPLSDAALDMLYRAKDCHYGSDLVFPSPLKPGRPLSNCITGLLVTSLLCGLLNPVT